MENYNKAYNPGDNVIGKLECNFTDQELPKGIFPLCMLLKSLYNFYCSDLFRVYWGCQW